MLRDRLPYVVLPVAAFLCIFPLILNGPSCGHDFTFHLLNWFEAAAQFRHGNLHPQWAFSPAWNAGEPRFVFYPPLSWTLGAVLGLLMPWTLTPIVYTWLALTASGLAMHRLARAHAAPNASLLAATLYLANPYMLFTAYERTAYAELLAAAFLPLLFHAILKPRPTIPAIAGPLAVLWLANAPAAVMGTYTLALLATIRLGTTMKLSSLRNAGGPAYRLATTTVAGTLLGLSLAAFYIVPAASERPLVQIAMVNLPGMRVDDNTLFHHTGQTEDALAHDAVLHTASLISLVLLSLTSAALLLSNRRCVPLSSKSLNEAASRHEDALARRPSGEEPAISRRPHAYKSAQQPLPPVVATLAIVTLTVAVLLTPLSLTLWHHAPELAFLQFPWRLLAVQAVALSLASAIALTRLFASSHGRMRVQSTKWHHHPQPGAILACLVLAATLAGITYPNLRQPCDAPDTVQARIAAFQTHQGAEPTDEYTPAPADNDSLHPLNPPFWLSSNPDAPAPAGTAPGPAPRDLTLTLSTPEHLILNLREYPAWHITLNNVEVSSATLTQTPRADGLLNLSVPPGRVHLELTYRITPLEHAAEILSACALLLLSVLLVRLLPAGAKAPSNQT